MEALLKKEIILNKATRRLVGIVIFIILTSLAAFVRIPLPFTPVPITLQTFFVLLSGLCLGSRLGFLSQCGYVFLGTAGLSVFTGSGSGLLYLFGPTGGYLVGFTVASFLAGRLARSRHNNLPSIFIKLCLADFVLLACGATWLKFLLGCSLAQALLIGFLPFLAGDLFKILIASILYLRLRPRLERIF
jgi:biotin transport system substrate-specific component